MEGRMRSCGRRLCTPGLDALLILNLLFCKQSTYKACLFLLIAFHVESNVWQIIPPLHRNVLSVLSIEVNYLWVPFEM